MSELLYDADAELAFLSKQDIINSITLQDVQTFLESLGVDQIEMHEEKGYLICPTICHNPIHEAESMKLYWYQNNHIFRCYTECDEAMSIFRLYQKFMDVNYNEHINLQEAEDYVKRCLKHIITLAPIKRKCYDWDTTKYHFNSKIPTLDQYPEGAMDLFIQYYHPAWIKEGITKEVMKEFNIRFSSLQNKIVIPHYDINGRLIGIRGRALNPQDIEEFGKYRPMQVGSVMYTHPLQFNLYGIYEHQNAIRKTRTAIIAEGEKSVLLDNVYYDEWANAVACCGSKFNKYHISLLTDILGANEVVVALDKEYEDWRTGKAKVYRQKLDSMCRKYKNQASFSYIWDYDNLLEQKDSPFDKGKEVFEELYKNRVKVI